MRNADKDPSGWAPDIVRSVEQYNTWYLGHSPRLWAEARGRAVTFAAEAFEATADFRDLSPEGLARMPAAVMAARTAASPPLARERVSGFAGIPKAMLDKMERDNALPRSSSKLDGNLRKLCSFLRPLLDPDVFVWVRADRSPTALELDHALLLLGERLTRVFYDPVVRNAQEARQKALLREFLLARGYTEQESGPPSSFPPRSFGMGRNVPARQEDGVAQNMPIDCVVRPAGGPLLCIELKSAGDFTNVNKRRKEESDKAAALEREQGSGALFLLQLFGYFGERYLGFERSAGIDWAWDHRLEDLGRYL